MTNNNIGIPERIRLFNKVLTINLKSNIIKYIIKDIFNLEKLKELNLSVNQIRRNNKFN